MAILLARVVLIAALAAAPVDGMAQTAPTCPRTSGRLCCRW